MRGETIKEGALLLLLLTTTLPNPCNKLSTFLQTSGEFLQRISIVQPVLVAEPSGVPRVGVSTVAATTSLRSQRRVLCNVVFIARVDYINPRAIQQTNSSQPFTPQKTLEGKNGQMAHDAGKTAQAC